MAHTRKRVGATVLGLSAIAAIAFVPATPAQAEPDIEDVKARVDRLYHEAEAAQERLHDAKLDLADLRRDLAGLKADQERQDERLDAVRDQVSDAVVRQSRARASRPSARSSSPRTRARSSTRCRRCRRSTTSRPSLLSDYDTELEALDIRREATDDRTDRDRRAHRAAERREGHGRRQARRGQGAARRPRGRGARARARLPQQRTPACPARTSRPPAAPPPPSSTRMAQVGDAYVYGAIGRERLRLQRPHHAWPGPRPASRLPHSSSAQFGSGPRIAASDLQPGDLVFYYSPISHVGMYIGNGLIVHAANPGTGVAVAGLYSMPYVGAVRPG